MRLVDLELRRAVDNAELFLASGDVDSAIVFLEELTATPRADADWLNGLIALSRCYRESGDFPRAIDVGEQAPAVIDELGISGLTEATALRARPIISARGADVWTTQ